MKTFAVNRKNLNQSRYIFIYFFRSSPTSTENSDHAGPLLDIPSGVRPLRRNSISLPAGLDSLDMAILQNIHQMDDGDSTSEKVSLEFPT